MEKVVLLDFCGTVVPFQTFDRFMEYILCREKKYFSGRVGYVVKRSLFVLQRIAQVFRIHRLLYKEYLVRKTRGISKKAMERYASEYYEQELRPCLISDTEAIVKNYISRGYRIIILSAACDLYLKYYAKEHGIKDIVSTRIRFKDGCSVGRISGTDCIGGEKVNRLKKYMEMEKEGTGMKGMHVQIEAGISDSVSDLPMLLLCHKQIVISHKQHQDWVTDRMEEIIWD